VIWSAGVVLAGYALGSTIPSIDTYLLPIIAVIVIVSLIPVGLELFRARSASRGRDKAPDGSDGDGSDGDGADGDGGGPGDVRDPDPSRPPASRL
jgi:membrane-associated protein